MNSTMYNTKEAARRLGYSIENIYRLTFAGKLTPTKLFGRNLYSEAELIRFESTRKSKKLQTVPE